MIRPDEPALASRAERLRDLPPLWMAGLVAATLWVAWQELGLSGEQRDWTAYYLLGSVLPLGAIALGASRSTIPLRRALGVGGLLGPVVLVWPWLTTEVAAVATITWVAWIAFSRRLSAVHLLVIVIAWCALSRVAYWRFDGYLLPGSTYHLLATATAVAVIAAALARSASSERRLGAAARALAACLAFALTSVRAAPIYYVPPMHHWGAIVGPAEAVREGGWLLWDIPAQYGFLSTLTLAAMPAGSVWQSFYILNAVLSLVAACILFFLLRGRQPGLARDAFAFVVAEAAVFLLPGFPEELTGPWYVPNISAFRFFWCYQLLVWLFWLERVERDRRRLEPMLAAGCVVWLAATLWSAESAFYSGVIWLPAFAGIVVARFRASPARAARWLALPPTLLLASVAVVEIFYRARLGHGPDWRAFVDYALAFGRGYNAVPIAGGPAPILVLALWALASVGAELVHQRAPAAALGLAWGAWATVFSTASYFVHRSHNSIAINLLPLAFAGLAAALVVVREYGRPNVGALVCAALLPVFATAPLLTLVDPSKLPRVAEQLARGYVADVDALLPDRGGVKKIVSDAGLTIDDPIAYLDWTPYGNMLPPVSLMSPAGPQLVATPRAWLPTPVVLFIPLSQSRATVYLERWVARRPGGGWLLEPQQGPDRVAFGWLVQWINGRYRPVRTVETKLWRLTKFEPRGR
jgi:hypothetical protein